MAPDPTKVFGRSSTTYGFRSQFEDHVARERIPIDEEAPTASWTPLHDARGVITPSSLHYEVHLAGVPTIDPARHVLLIHGLVERPLKFTLNDLMRFPTVNRIHFLECGGNLLFEWHEPMKNVQQTHGIISGSEWTGVPLSTLLQEVGLKPDARWIVAEGADAARVNRSIPIEKALDDAMVAYGQNGEVLRPEQGYPMRLFLPGWEGNTSIKWLHFLKVTDQPYQTRMETSQYTELTCREDDCTAWQLAELQTPVLPKALTVFCYPRQWNGKETILQSRCTDETGNVQPTRSALLQARGTTSTNHYNAIQSWKVAGDGSISNIHVS